MVAQVLLKLTAAKLLEVAVVSGGGSIVAHVEVTAHRLIVLLPVIGKISLCQCVALASPYLHSVLC